MYKKIFEFIKRMFGFKKFELHIKPEDEEVVSTKGKMFSIYPHAIINADMFDIEKEMEEVTKKMNKHLLDAYSNAPMEGFKWRKW